MFYTEFLRNLLFWHVMSYIPLPCILQLIHIVEDAIIDKPYLN